MDPRHDQDDLARQIADAPTPAVLLLGPAGAGKTTAALPFAQAARQEAGAGRCPILVPGSPARADMLDTLARQAGAVLIAPTVLTFHELCSQILHHAGQTARPLDDLERHLLLRQIVADLRADNQLAALGPVADTPGLPTALDHAIAELKRAAVDPDHLTEIAADAPGKIADLLAVYRTYQQRLNQANRYDTEGLSWLALECLQHAPADTPILDGLRALVVDGFTDFTPTQLKILRLLSDRLDRLVITLPWADDRRPRLWSWTARTRERLRNAFGETLTELSLPGRPDLTGPQPVAASVFDYDAPTGPVPDGLAAIAGAGIEGEVRAVARRIKRLLLAAGPERTRILLTARNLSRYRAAIDRTFAEFDLPLASAAQPLTHVPVVRFCLAAAGLKDEDFDSQAVLRVLRNSYFVPARLGPFDASTVVVAEMLIRTGNVLGGRDTYRQAAERLAQRGPSWDDESDDPAAVDLGPIQASADALRQAADLLDALFALTDHATAAETIEAVIDALALSSTVLAGTNPVTIARDLRALEQLRQACRHIGDQAEQVDALARALDCITLAGPRGESVVDVLDVLDARAGRWDHVFLLGCSEGQFPQPIAEASLIGETERDAWRAAGLPLDNRGDLTAREMLLFYLAVTRAKNSLTLTYNLGGSDGGAGPGAFLDALLLPVGGLDALRQAGALDIDKPGNFAPVADEIASRDEALRSALAGWFADDTPAAADALADIAHTQPALLGRLCGGLLAEHVRWQPSEASRFDGRLTAPAVLQQLARRYPKTEVFSASSLGTFGRCPWRYFARYVLGLGELVDPQPHMEAVGAGLFCHNVLFRLYRTLRDDTAGPVCLPDVDEGHLLACLDAAVAAEADRVEAAEPPFPMLWQIQRNQMHALLRTYLLDQRANDPLRSASLHFELGFGLTGRPADIEDAASTPGPVEIDTPAGPIRLKGKIDRIDDVSLDNQGGLVVVDYKTGKAPSPKDLAAGLNVQMPLYAEAAQRLLGRPCLGGAFHSLQDNTARYDAGLQNQRGGNVAVDDNPDARSDALLRVGQFVQAMAAGQFDLAPANRLVCRYCPYRQCCHLSPARQQVREARP